jgi:hypothetical protein
VTTSFGELPDFFSAALKLKAETKALHEVSQGCRVWSDVTRKNQLHKNIQLFLPFSLSLG